MGFLDFLKSKLFGNVASVNTQEFGYEEGEHIEVNNPSLAFDKRSYWKEFYLPDGTHVSRHGRDSDFESLSNENDWGIGKELLFKMSKREDYENQDPIFDPDYNDIYP